MTLQPLVMKRRLAIVVAVLIPSTLSAQATAQNWPGLAVSELSTVYVLDDIGVQTSGRFLRLNPDSLELLVGDTERRFEAARVRRIDKRGDSLRNGALIGTVGGVVMGLLSAGLSDCPSDDPSGSCPGVRAALVLFSAGVYAAIGTAIDALRVGRTTLYNAPVVPRSSAGVESAPPPYGRRAALHLSVRW